MPGVTRPEAGTNLPAPATSSARAHANPGSDTDRRSTIADSKRAAALRVVAVAVVTLAATLAFAADWQSPVRVVLVISFLLLAPGLAVAESLEIRGPSQQLMIAAGASLAIDTLVATSLLYADLFSGEMALAVVVVFTLAALLVAGLRIRRSPTSVPDPAPPAIPPDVHGRTAAHDARGRQGRRATRASTARALPPSGVRAGRVTRVGALLVTAVVAGFLLGKAIHPAGEGPAPLPLTIVHDGMRVQVPTGWTRADVASVPGFSRPLELRNAGERLAANVERLPATSPTLLPAALARTLGTAPGRPAAVRLASGLPAWRYRLRQPRDSQMVVYAAPTTGGVATVSCAGPVDGDVPRGCAALADAITLSGTRALVPGRSAAFYSLLPAVVGALDTARARGLRELAAAERPGGQASAAGELARAHRAAGRSLGALTVKGDGLPTLAADSLSATAGAYVNLARAARARLPKRYNRAARSVARTDTELRRTMAEVSAAAAAGSYRVVAPKSASGGGNATALLPPVVQDVIDTRSVFSASETFGVVALVLLVLLLMQYGAGRAGAPSRPRMTMLAAVIAPLFVTVMLTLAARIDELIG